MLPNSRKQEGEEEQMLLDVEKDYHQRVQRLQQYVPFLRKMIEHLEGAKDKNRETQLTKMRSLLNILTDSHKKLKVSTIQRCEEILQKLYSKVEGVYEWSTGLPSVKEKLSVNVESVEKEDTQNSNGSLHSPLAMESPVSVESSSKDETSSTLWRRRKTAMEFFEETPRSPSPPPSSELGKVSQPLVIPMEREEDTIVNSIKIPLDPEINQSIMALIESKVELPPKPVTVPFVPGKVFKPLEMPMERKAETIVNSIKIPLEPAINQSIMALIESKVELPPKPVTMPLERKEDFESKWYLGDSRYPDPGRQKNNFGVINSSLPSDPGISHRSNSAPQHSLTEEVPKYSPLHGINKTVSDIPSLEELRIQRRSDVEHHGSERKHIPVSETGEKFVKNYDHCQSNPGWSDMSFEGRRNRVPFQHRTEPSNIPVVGKAQVYDYAHGHSSASDSVESAKDSSTESEGDKSKVSPKNASSARASIREKLALEINKVHRVGVSSGGALRSLSKDLGSPPHKKVEHRDVAVDPVFRKTSVPVKLKEGEQTHDKASSKDRVRTPSETQNFAEDDFPATNSFYMSSESLAGNSTSDSHKQLQSETKAAGMDEATSSSKKMHQNDESKNSDSAHSESIAHEDPSEVRVLEEFSFKKKLLESKMSPDIKATVSPSIVPATPTISEDDQNSKMSLCDGDSDSDSKIPFLESTDSEPPPEHPNLNSLNSSCGFSDPRYLPSPCVSPAPHLNASNIIQPFVNPSNPSLPSPQSSVREESPSATIWPNPSTTNLPAVFPTFCPQNQLQPNQMHQNVLHQNTMIQNVMQQKPMQQNVNLQNVNIGSLVIHHSITPPNHLIQPNNSSHNHNLHIDNAHLVKQPHYMSGGSHPVHNMNVPSINQGSRPLMKSGLLPDPVAQFRHGNPHCWSQGNSKSGLLPHPMQRPNWRKDSYARPAMNQYMAEPRSSSISECDSRSHSARDSRSHSARGSWNSRRGGYSKDPRVRKPDHSRSYYDSSEPPKKSEEKFWKHPSDPRRANPAILEKKCSTPPVEKDKTIISSPLNSLYDSDQTPKTGKGYGLQKFRIPKIKRSEAKGNVYVPQNLPRPATPPRGHNSCRGERVGSTESNKSEEGIKVDTMSDAGKKDDNSQENNKKEVIQSTEEKKEKEDGEGQDKKSKEEFTKELFQTLLKISLESKEGTNILENSKFLDELREKLKLHPRRKSRPIIESDTESSEEEVEEVSPIVNRSKKRCRVIIESSESESCGDEKQDHMKSPVKTPPSATKTRSPRKSVKSPSADLPEERPRTRSQRKLLDTEEDTSEKEKGEAVEEVDGEHQASETERNDVFTDEIIDDGSKTKTPNRRTKRRSSLELLQEDIREMFICEGVLSATGIRMCRMLKEAAAEAGTGEEISAESSAAKDKEDWEEDTVSSCKDESAPDQSDENFEVTPPKSTRRRGSGRKDSKVTSLQPRVVLKKSEIVDGCDFPKTAQTAVRGGFARRSIRRTLNLGNRSVNSTKSSEDETAGQADDEGEDKKENGDERRLRSRSSENKNMNQGGKKPEAVEENQSSQPDGTAASVESSDNSNDGASSAGECDINGDNDEPENCSASGKEDQSEPPGKAKLVDPVFSRNNSGKVLINRSSLKKVNSKAKRSKANRRWALGVLKRAVNHKRRGLRSTPCAGIINKETSLAENMSVISTAEDLTDVNYNCVGSDSARCKLCAYHGKQIVNHYVTKHPESDVLVSRLSLQQAKIAMDWTETNIGALKNAKQALKSPGPFVCLMCEAWFTDYTEFYDHVTTHTGEYRFSCKMCPYRSFRDNNVRSHAYYMHQKKYCESSQCFEVIAIEDVLVDFGGEENELEHSSSVIPGLVAHMCSKCNFVQIAEEGVRQHIAKRHEKDDIIKILKIDLSLISPEAPSEVLSTGVENDVEDDAADFISEETNASGRDDDDDDDMNDSINASLAKKDEYQDFDATVKNQFKNELVPPDESEEVVTPLDENVFVIQSDLMKDSSNENCDGVWTEILKNPEYDEDISIIKLKLNVKVEDGEDQCSKPNSNAADELKSTNQLEESKACDLSMVESESSKIKTANEAAGVSDFGVIQLDGGRKPERKADGEGSHTSEVEIIEIHDSDSSESEESSYDDSSSESEESSGDEWSAPPVSDKDTLFSLDFVPEVKVQTNLLDVTNKIFKLKENTSHLETKAVVLCGGDSGNDESLDEGDKVEAMETAPTSSPDSSTKQEEVPQPRPGKIRVRCLSGDLLSSTKDSIPKDDINNTERDSIIDVIGTSSAFDINAENPLCQISSVCSLHPNEQVPEEFIKAVSENETPDLTSLAAYTPITGSPQSMFAPEDMTGDKDLYVPSVNGSRQYRPILPKGSLVAKVSYVPNKEMTGSSGEGSNVHQPNMMLDLTTTEKMSSFPPTPSKTAFAESEAYAGTSMGQQCSQAKICSIMRASLYAKASKTPTVFNQVMSSQVKLCHLFKCMGRQCSFTTDESVVFLSHFLGHESLVSEPPAASNSSSGENGENQEKRFDWQQCCYCAEMFSTASAYVKHVKIEHGECTYQCPYCFYRAAAVSYVILHQNSTHITEKVSVLQCKNPLKKSEDEDINSNATKPHLEAFVCYQGNCKRSFYSPSKYLSHLQLEHSAVSVLSCHKCSFQCFKADRLVQHYKLHSFYLYQCVYCEQGSDTSEEILQHLASFHPNKKASVCKRNCQETSNGSARTTGRHPYILYEDIELTEMENVELIRVGEEMGKRSTVTRMTSVESISISESDLDAKQAEDYVEMDDDNSDDEDNLVIAEDPEEETSAKENDDSIHEMETVSFEGEAKGKSVHRDEGNVEESSREENTISEEANTKKNQETANLCGNINGGGNEKPADAENEKTRSEVVRSEFEHENALAGMANSPLLSPPKSKSNFSQLNSSPKPTNSERSLMMSPKGSKSTRNKDELNVSTTDDEVIDAEGNRRQEMRLLRRRDVRRPSATTNRSQVQPKSKSAAEEIHNTTKEAAPVKDPSSGKVDLSELYRCCFAGCSFLAKDCNSLKYHMKNCKNSNGSKEYLCPHCSRKFKLLLPMLKHLRVHGKKNFVCMVCEYQSHNMNLAVRHVKFRHRASATTVSPLTDWDEPEEMQSSIKDQKLVVVAPKEVSLTVLLKKRFVPDDADYLPLPCVYTHEAKCGRCSYSTKIRVNMRRHLHLHHKFVQAVGNGTLNPDEVPWSVKDVVNPMPCLEGNEMMFDKMTNWALSSHLDAKVKEEEAKCESRRNSSVSEYEEDDFVPRFVPENERYICGVIGCHYHTVDDTMLRHHLRALHREENTFRCPHCPDEQNFLLQVPVDRLASHLKMHDEQLYQCIHCNYFHFQRRFVERHAVDKHNDTSYLVNVIREPDTCSKSISGPGSSGMAGAGSDGSNRSSRGSGEPAKHGGDNMWNCGLCSFSCCNRESISDHAKDTHTIFSQYVCGMCPFRTSYLSSFNVHFSTKHLGYPVQLIANYFPSNIAKLALPTVTISLPNGKIIFPPNPTLSKNVDIRSEPVIEVWPYVEQGFGKSSSSSVRLKELNTTYPWQRCMPRVRYIRGIPLADEGEETMYDLAESLKVKDVLQNDEAADEEENDSSESKKSEASLASESEEDSGNEGEEGTSEDFSEEGVKTSLKRRLSDLWKRESTPVENRHRTESVRSLTPVKASPSKRSCVGPVISSPVHSKVSKVDTVENESARVEEKAEEVIPTPTKDANQGSEKQPKSDASSSKVESLIKQYGEFGVPEGNLFVCPRCNKYKTKYKGDMKDHFFRELNYKRFVCTHCGFLAPVKNRLQKHYLRVHRKEGKREAIAELPPDYDIELWVTHALSHQCGMMKCFLTNPAPGPAPSEGSGGTVGNSLPTTPVEGANKLPYGCKYCTSKFATTRGVKLHFKVYHLKIGSWICGYCDVSANSSAIISKHSKSSHPEQPELIVNSNIASFIDAKTLDDSVILNTNGLQSSSNEDGNADLLPYRNSKVFQFRCSDCDYQTDQEVHFKRHKRNHAYGCGHCMFTAGKEEDVAGHHLRNHPSLSRRIVNRLSRKDDQSAEKDAVKQDDVDGGDITVIDLCSEAEESKEAEDEIAFEQEIIVTLDNIGDHGKSNPSFIFKCYYCRMKSFSCDDVVNHWENTHLPTDIHNTHPFKCKRLFAMKRFTFPYRLFQCAFCNQKGTLSELKWHFKTDHHDISFKVMNLQSTKYCCLLCAYTSFSFSVLENHFKNLHSSKDLEYQMRLADVDGHVAENCGSSEEGLVLGTVVGNSFKASSKRDTGAEEQFLKDAVFTCCVCNYTYTAFNVLERHHFQNHDASPLRFTIEVKFGKSNESRFLLRERIIKNYSCSSCSFITQSLARIFEHIRGHALPYQCGHCDFRAELPSKVCQHHNKSHPMVSSPAVKVNLQADMAMADLFKELKVTCEASEPRGNALKRRAPSPLECEPKKYCPVARKSTTQVFPHRGPLKPTARKSTNPSAGLVRNLKFIQDSERDDVGGFSSSEEQDSDVVLTDVEGETVTRSPPIDEFSFYTGGRAGQVRQCATLSRITVWMTFGGCAAKRVPVSKMAQLVDLDPHLCIEDVMKGQRGS